MAIVDIQLGYLGERMKERSMSVSLDDAARERLAEAGYDPVYGARPLKRTIQHQLENPLAQQILDGSFGPGDTIAISVGADGFKFVKGDAAAA